MLIDKAVAHTIKRPRKPKKVRSQYLPPDLREIGASLLVLESPPLALYLLGNIQTGKSKKKTLTPRMGPGLEENLLSQASTYVRNIQTGKSKKVFLTVGEAQAGREIPTTAPYLFKEHREGKKREKILVPVRFSRTRLGERGHSSRPGKRAKQNRLRHLLTIWRGVSSRTAITSLDSLSAARRMILARTTSQYGDVYFRARDSRVWRSSGVRATSNWLLLGIRDESPLIQAYQITAPNMTS